MTTIAKPDTIEELAEAVRSVPAVCVHGAMTKSSLVPMRNDAAAIDLTGLTGVTEYEPTEFTFTAMAGTTLREIDAMLAEHGQYLPFDPPLIDAGATLGGTVAAGLSGPGRLRYGGVRDFVLGVRFVDGTGVIRYAGGKVVKNVAGFDVPKLLVGSAGRLAAIGEMTFKVFPRPHRTTTATIEHDTVAAAVGTMTRLSREAFDLDALELEPPGRIVLRIAGAQPAVLPILRRIEDTLGPLGQLGEYADEYWERVMGLAFVGADRRLLKVSTTPSALAEFDRRLDAAGAVRRYSVAGNVAWIGWPVNRPLNELANYSGIVLRSPTPCSPRFGPDPSKPFYDRIKRVFDPENRFGDW